MDEQEYIKGFNNGYSLKEHKPLLFETVSKGLIEDTPYRTGFRDGGNQFEKERRQEQIKDRFKNSRTNERTK